MRLLPVALTASLLPLATSVHAHPGHGAAAPWHWHASDTFGLLVVGALAALALWFSRRR